MTGVSPFPQRPNLRLVPRQPKPQRLSVRIGALDGRTPYARSRPFRFSEADLHELFEIAARMERRP